jgi:penicillin-binding protein 2
MNKPEPRAIIIGGIVISFMLTLLIRLFFLQLINDEYEISALNNSQRHIIQYPPRGIIYDRDSTILVSNKAAYDLMVIPRQVTQMDTLQLCNYLNIDIQDFRERLKNAKNFSGFQVSIFYKMLSAEEYASLQEILFAYEGFFVQPRVVRQYKANIGAHVFGDIGEVSTNTIINDSYYKMGDYCGVNGLEMHYEKVLRGEKGIQIFLVDAHNRIKEPFKKGEFDKQPVAGKSLLSSLDADLQAYGEKLMQNKVGGLVAIEPSTGEILAMVSSPGYNPNLLIGRKRGYYYDSLLNADFNPLFNRAINSAYPPGSTFKVAQALVAMDDGLISKKTGFSCNKSLVGCHNHPDANNVSEALQYSCNPYFYQVFKRLIQRGYETSIFRDSHVGLNLWKKKIELLGFGQSLDIGLPSVSKGQIPGVEYYDALYGKYRWAFSTIYSLSIGQGEILATPLQLANFTAIIANHGWYYTPHLVKAIEGKGKEEKYLQKHILPFDTDIYPALIDGMDWAVNKPHGTARLARVDSITVCGKTGTAENPHGEDHSIFMAFAPKENPKIAIAVYVENSGFGGTWAAPVAGLMIEYYLTDTVKNKWSEQRILDANLLPVKDSLNYEPKQ